MRKRKEKISELTKVEYRRSDCYAISMGYPWTIYRVRFTDLINEELMYKWNPEDYQQHSSAQESIAESIISGLKFEGNEHILDIGCGDGKVTSKLASLVPQGQVLGIDSSVEMVEFARKRFPSSNHANLRFEQLDVLDLKFESRFDLVTSFACLHWVKDHLAVLKSVKSSLKPGGKLLFQCAGRNTKDDLLASGRNVIRSDKWKKYFREFSNPYGYLRS